MPTVQQLRYLSTLADTLSFSRAAEICGVAQPTLSLQLKELERRLGARLVERTRAKVILTPLGSEVVRRARVIIAEIDDIREISQRADPNAPQAILQIGVVQTVGAYVLSVAMPQLRTRFPNMRIRVREESKDALLRQLSEGAHDVVLLPEEIAQPGLICTRVLQEPMQVVLPAEHPLAKKDSLSPDDLKGEIILTVEPSHHLNEQIVRLCNETGAVHTRDYEGTSLDTLRQMVAAGMGISLLPTLYVRSEVMREELVVARPLFPRAPVRNISIAWRRGALRERTYSALYDSFRDSLRNWEAEQLV